MARSLVALLALVLVACSGKSEDGICTEGETQFCTCVIPEGRVLGEETCTGGAWGQCVCGDAPRDGGMIEPERDAGVIRDAGPRDGGLPRQCVPIQTRRDEDCEAMAIAAGDRHTCVLRASGELSCFGDDTEGQLGRRETVAPDPMAPWGYADLVKTATAATMVDADADYTCYLDDVGAAWCFGSNENGKLGGGEAPDTLPSSRTPVRVIGVNTFESLSLGRNHACAIEPTSQVLVCWGSNARQQLGRGQPASMLPFAPDAKKLDGVMTVVSGAAGDGFTCVVDSSGRAQCLGKNDNGELGDGVPTRPEVGTLVNVRLPAMSVATQVVAGDDHACALLDDGTVYCWGSNVAGQIGLDATIMLSATPVRIDMFATGAALDEVVSLHAGARHTCARRMDRSLVCWGDQITLCDPKMTNKPVRPRSFFWYGTSSRGVAAGGSHTCAIRNDRGIHCFGDNTFGQSDPAMPNSACEHDTPVSILFE